MTSSLGTGTAGLKSLSFDQEEELPRQIAGRAFPEMKTAQRLSHLIVWLSHAELLHLCGTTEALQTRCPEAGLDLWFPRQSYPNLHHISPPCSTDVVVSVELADNKSERDPTGASSSRVSEGLLFCPSLPFFELLPEESPESSRDPSSVNDRD